MISFFQNGRAQQDLLSDRDGEGRPIRHGSEDLIALPADQEGIFGFGAGDGRVPGEDLACQYRLRGPGSGGHLARASARRPALMMQLPLVRETHGGISLLRRAEDIPQRDAGPRGGDHFGIDTRRPPPLCGAGPRAARRNAPGA